MTIGDLWLGSNLVHWVAKFLIRESKKEHKSTRQKTKEYQAVGGKKY
jgi:hypothetical protein